MNKGCYRLTFPEILCCRLYSFWGFKTIDIKECHAYYFTASNVLGLPHFDYICSVRISAFIIGIIVLAQSFMPCADILVAVNPAKPVSVLSQASRHQESNRTDDCSPFCHCTCCAGLSTVQNPVSISHRKICNVVSYNSYISSSTVEIAYPIFQPPKL